MRQQPPAQEICALRYEAPAPAAKTNGAGQGGHHFPSLRPYCASLLWQPPLRHDAAAPAARRSGPLAIGEERPNVLSLNMSRAAPRKTAQGFSEEATMNYLRTAILLSGPTALFMGIGYLIGGGSGAVIALLIAAGMNLASYWNADKLVLAMHDAHEVDETTAPDLVHLIRDLAQRAGLPIPRVYL